MIDRQDLIAWLRKKRPPGLASTELRGDTQLVAAGILDSFALLDLVSYIEDRYQITVSAREATAENFRSIDQIAAFIERKKDA